MLLYPTIKMSPLLGLQGSGGGLGYLAGGSSLTLVQTVRTFAYTGAEQSYTIPSLFVPNDGVQSIQLYVWGAGGGTSDGFTSGAYSGQAGCGGFAEGLLLLTAGTSCKIIVGQGGNRTGSGSIRFGGGGADPSGDGAGGGLSGLFETSYTHGNSIIIAGGGGGSGGNGGSGKTYYGGCGGGTNGEGGVSQSCGNMGSGGTQSGGTQGGGALQGGGYNSGFSRGGAGGGGYYGGGCQNGVSGCGHPGGGGGSGYLHGSKITSGSFSTLTHSRSANTVPESSNAHYVSGVGNGKNTGGDGGNGLLVIVENVYA